MNQTQLNETNSHVGLSLQTMTAIFIGLSVFGVLIFAANGLVFLLVFKERSLLRKSNYFLISLAVSDMSSGVIGIPILLVSNSFSANRDELFKVMDILNKFLAFSTILHILAATIERYIKVLAPLHYRRLVTRCRVLLILAGIWLLSLSIPLIEFAWDFKTNISKIYSITILSCLAIIPLFIMTCMTIHIFLLIKKQKKRFRQLSNRVTAQRERKRKHAERRATIVYSAMSFSFAISWGPYLTLALLSDFGGYQIPVSVEMLFVFMKFSSGLVDPLLYTFFKTDFQAALKAMVMRPSKKDESTIPMTNLRPAPGRSSSDD